MIRAVLAMALPAAFACGGPNRAVVAPLPPPPLPDSCAMIVANAPKATMRVDVRISLGVPDSGPDLRPFQRTILAEVLHSMDYPEFLDTEMGVARMYGSPHWADEGYYHGRDARIWFRSGPDGRLDSLIVVGHSTIPELQQVLIQAIRNAGAIGRLGTPPHGLTHVNWHVFVYADSGHEALPIFDSLHVRAPRAQPPEGIKGNPIPRFPPGPLYRGVTGRVLTQFVIDTDGSVRRETLRVLMASRMDFAKAVLSVLPRYRFRPATVEGCPVPIVVQMPFEFVFQP